MSAATATPKKIVLHGRGIVGGCAEGEALVTRETISGWGGIDPMTGTADWGLRSNQDDVDTDSFGGQNVFDVHTKSTATALDGTKYSTW